jgi:beta-hydroxylase
MLSPSTAARTRGVLRYHLGLIVPHQKEACRISVDSEVAHWEEGRSVVFDDTYMHEVWNETDEEGVVLFVDFSRPLPSPVSVLN